MIKQINISNMDKLKEQMERALSDAIRMSSLFK